MKLNTQTSYGLQEFLRDVEDLFNGDLNQGLVTGAQKKDLEFCLPFAGLSKNDLAINADGNKLYVTVTTKELNGYTRTFENYKKTFLVGQNYDTSNVVAKMENGLLTLKIPLKEPAKDKLFQITVN